MEIPPPEKVIKKNDNETRIIPVKAPKWEYEFTCKRCGSHLYTETPITMAKFGGASLGYKRARVCRICGAVEKIVF